MDQIWGGFLNRLEIKFTKFLHEVDTRLVEVQNATSMLCLGLLSLIERILPITPAKFHYHLNLGILLSGLLISVGIFKVLALLSKRGAKFKVWASLVAGTTWIWASALFFFVASPLLAFSLPLAVMSFTLFICHLLL